jgi:hypothetical protein
MLSGASRLLLQQQSKILVSSALGSSCLSIASGSCIHSPDMGECFYERSKLTDCSYFYLGLIQGLAENCLRDASLGSYLLRSDPAESYSLSGRLAAIFLTVRGGEDSCAMHRIPLIDNQWVVLDETSGMEGGRFDSIFRLLRSPEIANWGLTAPWKGVSNFEFGGLDFSGEEILSRPLGCIFVMDSLEGS